MKTKGSGFTVHSSRLGLSIVIILLAGALAGAAAGAEAVPAAGPFKVGEEVVILADGPGKGQQDTPHVAFGKNCYLVVWREGPMVEGGRARVLASRVSSDGKALDPKGIEVAPNKNVNCFQANPRVAFCKDVFLVVWQDFRNGKDYDILGARVSPEGKVLDAEPIKVAVGGGTQAMPDVASDGPASPNGSAAAGNGFMVVFQAHPDSPQELRYKSLAVPVGVDGRVGSASAVMDAPQPKIAWDGANYLVVCLGNGIFARLLGSKDSQPRNTHLTPPATPSTLSVAAQPGKGWLIVGHRAKPDFWGWGGPAAMRGYFLTPDGKLTPDQPGEIIEGSRCQPGILQPAWLDVQENGGGIPYGPNASAWDGRHFVVVWQRFHKGKGPEEYVIYLENSDLIFGRVDGWKPLDTHGVPLVASPAAEKCPALACEGPGSLLLVYTKGTPDGKVQVCARTLSESLALGQRVGAAKDTPLDIVLTSTAADAKFGIAAQPEHGTLSGTPPKVTYTPAASYLGRDSFAFTADNGRRKDSATVAVVVCEPDECREIQAGLVAVWRFDEKEGAVAAEGVAGNDGKLIGGPKWSEGRIGGGLKFDGQDDRVEVDSQPYRGIVGTFTMALWVYPEAARASTPEAKDGATGTGGQRYALFPDSSGAGISVGTNGVSVFEHAPGYMPSVLVHDMALTGWTHVAVVYENGTPTLYLNGAKAETGLKSGKIVHPSAAIGGSPYGWFQGTLDDVRIYAKALSEAQVAELAARGQK